MSILNILNLTFLDSILKMAKSTMSNQKIMLKEVAKGLIIVQVHTHCYWQKSKVITKRQEQLEVRSSALFSEELCCSEEVDNVKQVLM